MSGIPPGKPRSPLLEPLLGAAQLACGRAEGIGRFGNTPQAFLASLAPLAAFALVGAVLFLYYGAGVSGAILLLLMMTVAQLAPAILSHFLAVRWGREAIWLRYATAVNWCQLTIPVVAFGLLLGVTLASAGRLPGEAQGSIVSLLLAAYVLWLAFIVARHGLAITRARAALLVFLVNLGTAILILLPAKLVASG